MKTWLEYLGFMLVRGIARLLSFHAAGRLGDALGGAVFCWTPIRKRVTLENLERAFPELPMSERKRIAHEAYCNYARTLVESLWSSGASEEDLRAIARGVNPDVARDALARGKGLVLMSGHYGGWEHFMTAGVLVLGFPMLVIVQQQRNRRIDEVLNAGRCRFGNSSVVMNRAPREVFKILKSGKILILLGDQSGSKESPFVPLFGHLAATHQGPAAFALRTGAPLVMTFLVRADDGKYDMHFEEVDYTDIQEPTSEHVLELTRRHVAVLERYIRAHPGQWLWMHKRWKHAPPATSTDPTARPH